MNPLIMHINYAEEGFNAFGSKTIDDICKMAAEIGYDGIEFRASQPTDLQNISFKEYAQQIADAKKKYGLAHILFGLGIADASNPDAEARMKSIDVAAEKAKIANEICGTVLCNTYASWITSPIAATPYTSYEYHGSLAATPEQWDLTVDAYQQFAKKVEGLGMKFAFETHMCYIHDLPAPAKKLVDLIDVPFIGINIDFGNTAFFPTHPTVEEAIDLYGDKLFYTHLKNSVPVPGTTLHMPTSLAEGEINHRLYLKKLLGVGFEGPIGIEAPRPGDRTWYAKCDFEYAKSILDSLK